MSMTQLQATRLVAQEITNAYTKLEGTQFDRDYCVSFGGFTNAKRQLGVCHVRGKVRSIKLSKHLLESADEVILNTIRHELGHAFSPAREGHGETWKRCCRMIGLKNPSRLAKTSDMKVDAKYMVVCQWAEGKYEFVCWRHRKPKHEYVGHQMRGRPDTLNKLKVKDTKQMLTMVKKGDVVIKNLKGM